MAKKLQIKSATDEDGNLFMYAKPPVLKLKHKDEFEIVHKVKSTEPIVLKFYDLDDKGKKNKELSDFCKKMPDAKILTIDAGDSFDCDLSAPNQKYFAYTVENKDAGLLDPVIIIEDFAGIGGGGLFLSLMPIIGTGVGGLVIGAAGFAYFSRRRRAKAAAASESASDS